MKVGRALAGGLLLWLALPAAAQGAADTHWMAGWTRPMMSAAELDGAPPADSTVRAQVLVTAAGERIRLRFSNAFGTEPLLLQQVRAANAPQPGRDLIDPAGAQGVTFGGSPWVLIPPGADYLSDPQFRCGDRPRPRHDRSGAARLPDAGSGPRRRPASLPRRAGDAGRGNPAGAAVGTSHRLPIAACHHW